MNEKKTNWQSSESALALTLSMEKCVESWLKNNNGRNFQFTRFTFIDFVLTDRRSLRYAAKIGQWQIFQLSIFILSQEKC